jgi:hypothetical protein
VIAMAFPFCERHLSSQLQAIACHVIYNVP